MTKVNKLSDVKIIENSSFVDFRGELFTIWHQSDTPNLNFNHDKISISNKNVLRGLHTDKSWKFISCLSGIIQLVVVNFEKDHPEYLNWSDFILDSNKEKKVSILVPPNYLNGHLVLSDNAIFHYKWCYSGNYPDVDEQISINWADPKLNIKWHTDYPILSERDKKSDFL